MRLTTTPLLLSYKRSIGVFVLLLLVMLCVNKNAEAQNYITQGFESSTFPPSGWKVITSGGTSSHGTTSWARQTSGGVSTPSVTAHGGSAMAWYNSYWISSTGVSSLITAPMNFAAYTGGYNQVSFWYYNYTNNDYLDILVNTSDTDAGNHRGPDFRFKFPTGIVVQEEKGFGTLNHQIVHTHCNQIDADRVVTAGFDGNLELGSDAIGGGNQNRVAIAYPLEVEKPAKAPNLCVCARAGGSPNQWLDQFDHSVASVDINTGLRVSESARFFCHSGSSSAPGRTLESQVAQWSERRYTPPKELACFRRLGPDRVVEPGST